MQAVIGKLTKVLDLERRQGYENRAVIGGIEAFVPRWLEEAEGSVSPSLLEAVKRLSSYDELSVAERRLRVAEVTALAAEPSPAPIERQKTSHARHSESDRSETSPPLRMVDDPDLERPVVHLRGVGQKSAKNLERLGIVTIRDLLFYAPVRHNDYSKLKPMESLRIGDVTTIVGTVVAVHKQDLGPRRTLLSVILSDTTGRVACSFFNQPYLERDFRPGRRIVVSGKVESWAGRPVFRSPEWEPVESDLVHTGRLVPVYRLARGVKQRWLRRQIKHALEQWADRVGDPLPQEVREREGLLPMPEALRKLHFPESEDAHAQAERRLAFDELLTIQLWSRTRALARKKMRGPDLSAGLDSMASFVASLPFELTSAQRRAIDEIATDLASGVPMSRLLQGDVGSGKTVVAAAAIVCAVGAGTQAALMAPTEILAEQHARSLSSLLGAIGYEAFDPAAVEGGGRSADNGIARLVGSMTAREKAVTIEAIASGAVSVVVGTHAVIQDAVRFANLGLAVVDEQHRFGVLQRAALPQRAVRDEAASDVVEAQPAQRPHVLIMTATPIPRTLLQVLNADLEQSVIDELPPGRKPVETRWLDARDRERAYQFIRSRVQAGEQAYIVFSLVEESDTVDARAAVAEHQRLAGEVFPDLRVALIHGRMSAEDKDEVMRAFREGEVDVLVATSVIEVGVDVPNATVMMIDGADRFGLAQLHQFRGRIGRGEAGGVCLLLAERPSEAARKRLEAMTRTSDGMELAQLDLEMRGPGDYFGLRQSGLDEWVHFARLSSAASLADAHRVAIGMLEEDPDLTAEEHRAIGERVAAFGSAVELFT
jgi:ATP-dependent DNA helicase RecG